jgi:hypothetical protein
MREEVKAISTGRGDMSDERGRDYYVGQVCAIAREATEESAGGSRAEMVLYSLREIVERLQGVRHPAELMEIVDGYSEAIDEILDNLDDFNTGEAVTPES